jgi:hypothetical protein
MTPEEFMSTYGTKKPSSLRERLMDCLISSINWTSDNIIGPADFPSLRFSFGWWIQAVLESLWCKLYHGSESELLDGIYFALDGFDSEFLSPRQREIATHLDQYLDNEEAK